MIHPWQRESWNRIAQHRDTLATALLITAQTGSGLKSFVEHLTQWLLCSHPALAGACGKCSSCVLFEASNQPDFLELKPTGNSKAETTKIGDVRALTPFFALYPLQASVRVGVVAAADTLTLPGQNALLKLLEEPPPYAYLLMATPYPGRLLPTVRSRLSVIDAGSRGTEHIYTWLQQPWDGPDDGSMEALLHEFGSTDDLKPVRKALQQVHKGQAGIADSLRNCDYELLLRVLQYADTQRLRKLLADDTGSTTEVCQLRDRLQQNEQLSHRLRNNNLNAEVQLAALLTRFAAL